MPLFRRLIQVLTVCSVVTTFGTVLVQAEHGTGATQCHWSGQDTDHGNSLSGNNITCDCVDGHWRNCRYNHDDDGDQTKSCYFLGEETKHGDFWRSSTIACECKNAHWDCHYVDQGSNDERHEQGCHYRGQDVTHGERLTGETKSCECNHGKWRRCYDKDNHCHRDGQNYTPGQWYDLTHTNEKCYCEWDTTWRSQCEALNHNPDSSPTSPTPRPTSKPTEKPSVKPSLRPTPQPTPAPIPEWTGSPTKATPAWTGSPTKATPAWTGSPTPAPIPEWTGSPIKATPAWTGSPTPAPIPEWTGSPTKAPIPEWTGSPTKAPIPEWTGSPTKPPSPEWTGSPTVPPSPGPTPRPIAAPTERPTVPSDGNVEPTGTPTEFGTFPTFTPSARPSNVWVEDGGCETIAEFVCNTNDFTLLCAALTRLYLYDILNNPEGKYTFFAPNDTAFEKYLEQERVTEMTEINSETMKDVLYTNIMAGVLDKEDLIVLCGQLATMVNGKATRTFCTTTETTDADIDTTTDNDNNDTGYWLYQKGRGNAEDKKPKLIATDIKACNGIIHVVDAVILPAE